MTELTIEQSQNAVALAAKAITQDKAQAYELVGMIKAFGFAKKLVTVTEIKILQEIKEAKKYKGLELITPTGEAVTVTTFTQFCECLGMSYEKVNQDLQNLNVLGEDFLETSQRLGLGYREMRKLRQLPEEARAEIVEADYSETADKEDLIEKIEELSVKHAKEKESLQAQLKTAKDNYEAQAKVLANKNDQIDRLDTELAKKTKAIETQTPDSKGALLRQETTAISYSAEAILRGQVFKAFETLQAHTEETGIDHKQFMSGILAEYQLILSELKSHFGIDDVPSGEDLPEWARKGYTGDEDKNDIDNNLTALLDEISDADIVE
ncbi:hypothetical protein [Rodentibacter sp. Ppn85]|uniref:hypothetical protein n=1 Tax=Rodentibacter sp. Ppn85 TaxID=1908525 RepID=UPI0009852D7F|nr:hypothetical protein [Rodentibacter sp. Ppn85]OOF65152.1 hypothetical protein BKL51_06270 [Rodentibacter sp. Ppn85]